MRVSAWVFSTLIALALIALHVAGTVLSAPVLLLQLPWRLGISADQLRPIDHISSLQAPLLRIAGDQDRHALLEESQRLLRSGNRAEVPMDRQWRGSCEFA